MIPRDYVSEMRELIDKETADRPYVPRVVASNVVARLRQTDPDLLKGWLDLQAEHFVWQFINDRDRSMRTAARHAAKPKAFAQDVRNGTLTRWLNVPFTVEDGSRKRLAEMTEHDVLFAAETYRARARDNRMTEAFLRAVARKLEGRKVSDVYDDKTLSTMWNSLVGADEPEMMDVDL